MIIIDGIKPINVHNQFKYLNKKTKCGNKHYSIKIDKIKNGLQTKFYLTQLTYREAYHIRNNLSDLGFTDKDYEYNVDDYEEI